MLYRFMKIVCVAVVIILGSLLPAQSVPAETLYESNAETRCMLGMHVGQAALQKQVPEPWQVISIPGGPLKDVNFFMIFIDPIVVQDAQGKPNPGGGSPKVVFAVPARNTQTNEVATLVTGGYTANPSTAPGPYKNFQHAPIQRVFTRKVLDPKGCTVEDAWIVGETDKGLIELHLQYQPGPPFRSKSEQKVYSAKDPEFFRIYRIDSATDMVKNVPMNVDRIKDYRLRVTAPQMNGIFDGTEQIITISAIPLYVRQVFLP
ncbi:MAG: hypothetical protein KQI78_25850 [Deltaproteobacteria bacterium]|nr:hypothetical protein [Deltaproteobacteria bacterium]